MLRANGASNAATCFGSEDERPIIRRAVAVDVARDDRSETIRRTRGAPGAPSEYSELGCPMRGRVHIWRGV